MTIYTSTMRYAGGDRMDVTAKSAKGLLRWFAPTWDMVNGLRYKRISEEEYTRQYIKRLENIPKPTIEAIFDGLDEITFVCFCAPGKFCHRVLLAKWLEEQGVGTYEGERVLEAKEGEPK